LAVSKEFEAVPFSAALEIEAAEEEEGMNALLLLDDDDEDALLPSSPVQ